MLKIAAYLEKEYMNESVRKILDKVQSVPDFAGVDLQHINDTNALGDNALHCVCVWGDLAAAKVLVENGINIEQRGEGGFTPLKVADDFGHSQIVQYLTSKGADTDALNAIFEFDRNANKKHMNRLDEEINVLEQEVREACGNAIDNNPRNSST